MLYKDFSLHRLAKTYEIPDILHVGWLDDQRDFKTGAVPEAFLKKLNLLLGHPVPCPERAHGCKQCPGTGSFRAAAEYWVRDHKGKIFVAPSLVHHYITHHHYLPPNAYIDAVRRIGAFFKKSVIMSAEDVGNLIRPFKKKDNLKIGPGLGV